MELVSFIVLVIGELKYTCNKCNSIISFVGTLPSSKNLDWCVLSE